MEAYFEWLQSLAVPAWIAQSDSIWGFPTVLFLHRIGMGLSAGTAFVIALRLLGVGAPLLVSSLRVMQKIFWAGFVLNVVTGSLLFAAHATQTGFIPMYYAKLVLIAAGTLMFVPIGRFLDAAGDDAVPGSIKTFAALSIAVWVGVITTGRLIAYVG